MKKLLVNLLILTSAVAAFSQSPNGDEIVARAAAQRLAYIEEFKNLISREIRAFEIFNKNGSVKKRRVVHSTFLVYQLSHDEKRVAEFRNVTAVDGKSIANVEKRAGDLFGSVAKSESSKKELEKIQEEGSRFDEALVLTDLTLFQAVALAENMRPYFEFRIERAETIGGNDVHVLSYRQVKVCPYVYIESKKQPADGRLSVYYDAGPKIEGDAGERLSGEIWVDARTFQVTREVRIFTVSPASAGKPLKAAETIFDYQNSEFGILTPKTIRHTQFRIDLEKSTSTKEIVVTLEYDKFTKPNVEVRSSEVKP